MGQLAETLTGVGQVSEPVDALGDILYSEKRLGFALETDAEAALVALARLAEAAIDSEGPEPSNKSLGGASSTRKTPRRLQCSMCHLSYLGCYDPDKDYVYIITPSEHLLPIKSFRLGREFDHYRVVLVGDDTPMPVQPLARVFVSTESHLAGMTIDEVLK